MVTKPERTHVLNMNSRTVNYIHSEWDVTHVHVIDLGLEATDYMVDTSFDPRVASS